MDINPIIRRIKKGDKTAFGLIVKQYQEYAFKLAFRIVCDEEDAKDVVQESFIKIWRNIHSYYPSVKFATWMYKIVTHSAIDHYRKNTRRDLVSFDESAMDTLHQADWERTHNNHSNKELSELISTIAEGLPEKQRLAFVMRDLQGMDSGDVQEILEIPATQLKSNLYHARKTIKEKIRTLLANERRQI